jgi:hypothetical protein
VKRCDDDKPSNHHQGFPGYAAPVTIGWGFSAMVVLPVRAVLLGDRYYGSAAFVQATDAAPEHLQI